MSAKWDRRFMELAELVASWSKDPSSKIGCVLVNERREVVATGYNGFPRGVADDARLDDRPTKYGLVVHAEMNAVIQAGLEARGCTVYVAGFAGPPCLNCAKHLVQAGARRIIGWAGEPPERWREELEKSLKLLREVGVEYAEVER